MDGPPRSASPTPLVGITCDADDQRPTTRAWAYLTYARAVTASGGTPVLLPPIDDAAPRHVQRLDALVLTGGDDPRTEPFGEPTHPSATPIHALRQAYEIALLTELARDATAMPVLGICLGMQLMALCARGRLDQHLPETIPTADDHWEHAHAIVPAPHLENPPFGPPGAQPGTVWSRHRQAVASPGSLEVVAAAHDGVIEAIRDPARPFYLGVQWHPERTKNPALGRGLFDQLVAAARA